MSHSLFAQDNYGHFNMAVSVARVTGYSLVASPDAVVLPDGSILGVRPPQLPDRGEAPRPVKSGSS